jgi:hypothetical protein
MLNEKGQAVVEFILFLPFLLVMYALTVSIGNAINGSINQQKLVRGYLYAKILNNSTIPKPESNDTAYRNWRQFGMYFIGYNLRRDGNVPVAACYRLKSPLPSDEDECERYSGNSTQWIRVQTVYGICGATYVNAGGEINWALASSPDSASALESCLIR